MNANSTTGRDDLFTIIHKGLRLGLFDITVQAGRTDWADPAQVTDLGERWHGLLTLLRAHSDHEGEGPKHRSARLSPSPCCFAAVPLPRAGEGNSQ